jgi:predicted transposase/invertase (TIGR01784 family)
MNNKKGTPERSSDPHDEFVKQYLSEKETAASLFREHLPHHISRNIDYGSLEIAKDTFVDSKLSEFLSDLLYKVNIKKSASFIYVLIEHKSDQKIVTGFQLLQYMVHIWELFLKQNRKSKKLPVIIPLVIYHGTRKWKFNTDFISLFDVPENMEEYVPNFKYNLCDISHISDEEIKGTVLLRIMCLTLKYIFTPELSHKLPGIVRLLEDVQDKDRGTEYLEALLRYLTKGAKDLKRKALVDSITKALKKGGYLMATIAEEWIEEGKEIGIKIGEERGVKLGEKRGVKLGKLETATELLKNGISMDIVIKSTGLSRKEIEKLSESLHQSVNR